MSVRIARLMAEFEAMQNFISDVVKWEIIGNANPPDRYRFHYDLATIVDFDAQGRARVERRTWIVEVGMPANYPWGKPEVRFVGPQILHPNVWLVGAICIEDNYQAGSGIPLDRLCEHIGQIIAYQQYNLKSPANGDPRLFTWITTYGQSALPTDSRDIRRARINFGITQSNPPPSAPSSGRIKFKP